MSAELIKARSLLAGINSYLKQGKLIPATQALHDAVQIVLRTTLMKHEKEDFAKRIEQATFQFSNDATLKKVYPLLITYQPGNEKELVAQLGDLLKELQASKSEEVQALLADLQRRREEALTKLRELLAAGDVMAAKKLADKLYREHPQDTELRTEVADCFVNAGQHREALEYFEQALQNDPQAIHLYNRIGIVLRKMKDFATAEEYYKRALAYAAQDEYLWFNIGRLYYDWRKWDRMAAAAGEALKINPEFAEAQKMLQFAQKKL